MNPYRYPWTGWTNCALVAPAVGAIGPTSPGSLGTASFMPGQVHPSLPVNPGYARWLRNQQVQASSALRATHVQQAAAAGFTTPIRCSTFAAFHCSLYGLVPQPDGRSIDIHIAARPTGDATGLFAFINGAQIINVTGTGPVLMYPVAWVDAPGGPIWGWMADGSFSQ